ncbi:MAG TPA: hypothetical protein VH500_09160 [Nitrososphaeraceae archaeon]
MSESNKSSKQTDNLKKVVGLAMTDSEFRKEFVKDHKKAIDDKHMELGFKHTELSDQSHEVLSSLTTGEIDTLHEIFKKAERGGIRPVEMF